MLHYLNCCTHRAKLDAAIMTGKNRGWGGECAIEVEPLRPHPNLHSFTQMEYFRSFLGLSSQQAIGNHPCFNRVWCSGNIVDSHFSEVSDLSTARGSTPRIRVLNDLFFWLFFFVRFGTLLPDFLFLFFYFSTFKLFLRLPWC